MRSFSISRRNVLAGGAASLLFGCKDCGKGTGGGGGGGAVKVGLVGTMSGPQAVQGRELERGLLLALEGANMQAGGRKIEILKQDDKNDAQTGADIVKKFIEQDKWDDAILRDIPSELTGDEKKRFDRMGKITVDEEIEMVATWARTMAEHIGMKFDLPRQSALLGSA